MISRDFVIWLRGFTEACNDYTATPKQWDHIKEVLNEVQDYNDNPGIDVEIDNYKDLMPLTDIASGSSFSFGAPTTGTTVWNNKMGCWHYTNHPEGFGYFTNSTAEYKKEKQQLND